MKKRIIIGCACLVIVVAIVVAMFLLLSPKRVVKVDVSDLTYTVGKKTDNLKIYTKDDYEAFVADFESNNLPEVYVTNFLYDGAGMYKTYDLDDFIDEGNETEVKELEITAFNVNTDKVEFSGEIVGGMIAINTNDLDKDVTIYLNCLTLDTDSKKVPAVYVYNKDINYIEHKVTISAVKGTQNYIEGGKFKKVSLIPSEDLTSYMNKYSGNNKTNYEKYTNYYGVYTAEEIEKVLFAKVTADSEDLQDGDPFYFYKGAGAISSDIDLYFKGEGYVSVISKNKEGIETKGNLEFTGGTGDYYIEAQDDALNTTTKSNKNSTVRNALVIDVNSLTAYVSNDADEGDAIDSNGTLTINGGTIVALAKPGQDAGLDSETGTYINGGTVIATGDMMDIISDESKQRFVVLSFNGNMSADTLVTMLDENENVMFAFKGDRTYQNLVFSSKDLKDVTYTLYKDGEITGTENNGLYNIIDEYSKGTQLGYSSQGQMGGMQGGPQGQGPMGEMDENMTPPEDMQDERPELPEGEEGNNFERKNGINPSIPTRPQNENNQITEVPNSDNSQMPNRTDDTRPQMPDGQMPDTLNGEEGKMPQGGMMGQMGEGFGSTASNKNFTLSGISNSFSGVGEYVEITQ